MKTFYNKIIHVSAIFCIKKCTSVKLPGEKYIFHMPLKRIIVI